MARLTGLEPATLGVTGRYSNQLSYNRIPCPSLLEREEVLRSLAGGVKRIWREYFAFFNVLVRA